MSRRDAPAMRRCLEPLDPPSPPSRRSLFEQAARLRVRLAPFMDPEADPAHVREIVLRVLREVEAGACGSGALCVGPISDLAAYEALSEDSHRLGNDLDWEAEADSYDGPYPEHWEYVGYWDEPFPGTRGDALRLLEGMLRSEASRSGHTPQHADLLRVLVLRSPELLSAFRRIRYFVKHSLCNLCGWDDCTGICDRPPRELSESAEEDDQ